MINKDLAATAAKLGSSTLPGTDTEKSGLWVPILVGDEVARAGRTAQIMDRENAFSDGDVRLLTTIANSLSVALENARLFDETQRLLKETEQRAAELAIINSVQEGLASKLEMQAIYDLVGEKIRRDLRRRHGLHLGLLIRNKGSSVSLTTSIKGNTCSRGMSRWAKVSPPMVLRDAPAAAAE